MGPMRQPRVLHRPVEAAAKNGHERFLNSNRNLAHCDADTGPISD